MEESEVPSPSKIDLRFAEHRISFAITDCSLDKRYSFYSLDKQQARELLGRLKHIEKMTWRQFSGLDRIDGLTTEKSNTEGFGMIDEQNSSGRNLTEQYYFHFRIEKKGLFRIFGYQRDQFFYITHIDVDGCIYH